jgi:hypothetical protein
MDAVTIEPGSVSPRRPTPSTDTVGRRTGHTPSLFRPDERDDPGHCADAVDTDHNPDGGDR